MEKLIRHFNGSSTDAASLNKRVTNGFSIPSGCFGVRLDELCTRDGGRVPLVMIQMCAFLRAVGGLHTKGVFRVNGNLRVIENLRKAADSSALAEDGDSFLAHLERYGNIHSVASLIKLFLRELPVGLVPPSHTKELLESYKSNNGDSLAVIDRVIRSLPPPNYRLLEYLCCFLRQVTQYQSHNQMDSTSIGIVFGPNVFRCPRDSEGLASQSIINEIMRVLVEQSDVFFARETYLEVPSASLLRKKHSGGSFSLSPTSTPDETESGFEAHRRSSANHHPRPQYDHATHSPFSLELKPRGNTFLPHKDIQAQEDERCMTPSPTDTESQSVVNLASGVAEQLSATLQACLRTCVRQHAVPSPRPITAPSTSSHNRRQPSPIFSATSPTTTAATTSASHWLGEDLTSGNTTTSLLSPPHASSQPFHTTFAPSVDSSSRSSVNRVNEGNSCALKQSQASPLLQIPPPPPNSQPPQTVLNGSSWEEDIQVRTSSPSGQLINRSGDSPTEAAIRQSSSSQEADAILSVKRFKPRKISDSGWRPLGNSSPVVAEKVNVGSNGRGYYHGFPVIYPTGSTGSPQYRYPTHNPQEIHKSESMVDTYNDIVKQLTDNRLAANRPERLIDMTLQELEAEKLLMQRTLLNFESTYGRPQERNDRILMRPVYDRYRFVKRLLAAAASQDCVNDPDTPARVFAPPDVLESASVLSPLQMQTTTQHSDTCFSFIDNSSGDSAAAGDPVNVPSRYPPRHPSNENSQYPLVLSSSITSRGASLNSSSNSKTIPDEWFGSLGIPRVSGQRNRSSLCVSDADQHEMARSQVPRSIYASEPTVDQGKEEEETAGRRTPINNGSPEASGSGTLLGMTQSAHQLQQQLAKPRQTILASQPRTQWSGHKSALPDNISLQSQLFIQPSRQPYIFPAASFPYRRHQTHQSPLQSQQQPYQVRSRLLTGDDPETGKPLDQAIADYVAKYATFSVTELQTELTSVKESKRALQKFLKQFEHDFERKSGRKAEAEDRHPLNPEYMHYKMLKARLTSLERLLEARSTRISHSNM